MSKTKNILIRFLTCSILMVSLYNPITAEIAGDTIPPVFLTIPQDLSVSCDDTDQGLLFVEWFNSGGSSVIIDGTDTIDVETTVSFMEALGIIASSNVECDLQGEVEVGFFGLDSCQNSTIDTLFASFSLLDNELPQLISGPNDQFVICNAETPELLESWIQSTANAQVEDNCVDDLLVSYTWTDNQGNSGAGTLPDPANIPIARDSCDWFVEVVFMVSDGCGNTIELEARFDITDNQAPGYVPEIDDITISCNTPLPGEGNLMAVDACDGVLDYIIDEATTQDPDSTNCGHYTYELTRTYTAVDACGNIGTEMQLIVVQDTIPPSIMLQDTLMLSCAEYESNTINDFVDFFGDACSDVLISFGVEEIEVNDCDFAIQRNYTVRDRCNNVARDTQIIFVVNNEPPLLIEAPEDLIIPCDTALSYNVIFQQWLGNLGGAQVQTVCSTVDVFAAEPGSYAAGDPSTYPGTPVTQIQIDTCSGADIGYAHSVAVDFVFFDDCGNFVVSSAMAHVMDEEAPEFQGVCGDTLVFATIDSCFAEISFLPPKLSDNCGELESPKVFQMTQPITSSNPGDVSAVVDSLCFTFAPVDVSNLLAGGEVSLTVNLNNIDADDPGELFEIKDESGLVLGTTPLTSNQCGDTTLVIDNIPSGIVNIWAIDGIVKFWVVPVGTGVLAINDVCPGATVDMIFSYDVILSSNVVLSYSIDQGPEVFAPIADTINLGLDVGIYEIEYNISDCGGNTASCIEYLNIRDSGPPEITCPMDITLPIQNLEGCQSAYFLDESIVLADDCGLAQDSLQYSVSGATTIDITSAEVGDFMILEGGLNTITLQVSDASGNTTTCDFDILVRDTLAPEAICKDVTINTHPGLDGVPITASDLDNGSSDTCGDITFELSDTLVACDVMNGMATIELTVSDQIGNMSSCSSTVTLEPFEIFPVASLGFCDGDTLYLLPNLPAELQGFNYTYDWSGPGYSSNEESPTIFNASNSNNGEYTLTITGDGGCTATGSLTFNFEDAADQVEITSPTNLYCANEAVTLSTNDAPGAVQFLWYEGTPPNGVPITITTDSEISIFPSDGTHLYYVQIDFGSCLSTASNVIEISLEEPPVAEIVEGNIMTACTGEDLVLNVEDPINGVNYEWYDDDGFLVADDQLTVPNLTQADEGNYKLVAKLGPCVSDTARINVSILEGFETPIISGEVIYCEGSVITLCVENETDGEIYNWLLNGNPNPIISTADNKLEIMNATPFFSGEWTVVTQDFNCVSDTSASYEITVEDEIQIGASNNGPGCEGDSITLTGTFIPGASYTWTAPDNMIYSGQMVTVPAIQGDYNLFVQTAAGCENTTSTSVEVIPVGTITSVSNSSTACMEIGDTVFFQASVFPAGNYTYEWIGPNGFMSDQPVAILDNFTLQSVGEYQLTVFNNNCASNVLVTNITSNLIPPTPEIIQVDGFCDGDEVVLESSLDIPGVNYVWTTPSGTFNTTVPMLELGSGNQLEGFYTLAIDANDCISPESDTLIVSLATIPESPQIIGETDLCEGEDLVLSLNQNADTYVWSGLVDTTTTEPNLTVGGITTSGQVSVVLFNGGCQSLDSDVINIDFIALPEAPSLNLIGVPNCVMPGEDVEVCISNFGSTLTYVLLDGNGAGVNFIETECFTIVSELLASGENAFSLFAEQNACRSDEISFSVNAVQADFTGALIEEGDMVLCDNNEFLLHAINFPDGATLDWESPNSDIILVGTDDQVFVSNIQDGINMIILNTSIGDCINAASDTVMINVLSGVNANDDIVISNANESNIIDVVDNDEFGNEVNVTIIGPPVEGEAFVDDGKITYIPPSGFFGEVTIIYEICETACPAFCSRATVTIEVGNDEDCFVPTVITPNGDAVNDVLIIPCLNSVEFSNNELIIFNQWGDEVYSANPYRNNWEGTYLGEPLPVGTYYYVLDIKDGNRPINGFLIIER